MLIFNTRRKWTSQSRIVCSFFWYIYICAHRYTNVCSVWFLFEPFKSFCIVLLSLHKVSVKTSVALHYFLIIKVSCTFGLKLKLKLQIKTTDGWYKLSGYYDIWFYYCVMLQLENCRHIFTVSWTSARSIMHMHWQCVHEKQKNPKSFGGRHISFHS